MLKWFSRGEISNVTINYMRCLLYCTEFIKHTTQQSTKIQLVFNIQIVVKYVTRNFQHGTINNNKLPCSQRPFVRQFHCTYIYIPVRLCLLIKGFSFNMSLQRSADRICFSSKTYGELFAQQFDAYTCNTGTLYFS